MFRKAPSGAGCQLIWPCWRFCKGLVISCNRRLANINWQHVPELCRVIQRFLKFLDHLELLLEADNQTIEVRSPAMFGILDFGVNRYRVYELRKQLQEAGLIKRND